MNFLEYLQIKENRQNNLVELNEAFSTSKIDRVHDLMLSIFKKKIGKSVTSWGWYDTIIDEKNMRSFYFANLVSGRMTAWSLNYLVDAKSSEVYSISIYNSTDTKNLFWKDKSKAKVSLEISTLGTSVAYFIPIICHIVKNGDYGISKEAAIKLGAEIFDRGKVTESRIYNFGPVKYRIYENLNSEDIERMFYITTGYELVYEASPAQNYRWQKKKERDDAWHKMKQSKSSIDKENFERINAEYKEIVDAIRGGAQTLDELKLALNKNVDVEIKQDKSIEDAEQKVEEYSKDPEQAFKEMKVYVKTVLKGLQPGVILCGAPGIGKTYRILQQLKAAGYKDGVNMEIIKGKCTPRQLYLSLYNFKSEGEILVIDDADSLVGPKAPEDCINMLKAALDSTSTEEGRKISYRVSGLLKSDDDEIIPKTMYYKGGVIVITNYSVGQIDTALKGRTFIQSLDFSTNQLLSIIEKLLPAIDNEHLTMKSKSKALDYLKEMSEKGEQMEISIRTFTTCAKLFAVCEDDMDIFDDEVKAMIKEQMFNQYARGGKKF